MNNIQKVNKSINILSSQTFISYLFCIIIKFSGIYMWSKVAISIKWLTYYDYPHTFAVATRISSKVQWWHDCEPVSLNPFNKFPAALCVIRFLPG
jgi:hypothetical protein